MNFRHLFCCALSFALSLEGAAAVKQSRLSAEAVLYVKSSDDEVFQLDPIWIHESEYVAQKVSENSTLGTEKAPLEVPLTLAQLEELNGHMVLLRQGSTKQFKKQLMSSFSGTEQSSQALIGKTRELHALFKAIKTMGLKKFQPIALAGFLYLLKKEPVLDAFASTEDFIQSLSLPSEVAQSLVKMVSEEDQEFLRAQLHVTLKSHNQPEWLAVSPCGRYVVIAGMHKKNTSSVEIFNALNGELMNTLTVEYKIKGLSVCHDNQIITWGKQQIDLWNMVDQKPCTPTDWVELLETTKRIWGTALSADKKNLAVVLDEQLIVLTVPESVSSEDTKRKPLHKKFAPPAIHKRENKKTSHSEIVFCNHDQMLIEIRPGGDLLFYRLDTEKCYAVKKGAGKNIRRHYVNGSKFITISDDNEARVWNCKDDAVDAETEGKIPSTIDDYVSYERQVELKKQHSKFFCDTSSPHFMDKLVFLTAAKMKSAVKLAHGAIEMHHTDERGSRSQKLFSSASQTLQSAYLSQNGALLVGITTNGTVELWHIANPEVSDLLTSSMPLEQALFVQSLINLIGSDREAVNGFLRTPHIQKIFDTCNKTFRTLVLTSFSAQHPEDSQASAVSLSTSQKLLRGFSHGHTSNKSPLASPRPSAKGLVTAISMPHVHAATSSSASSPRNISHDSPRSTAVTPRGQAQSAGHRLLRGSSHSNGTKETGSKSPRVTKQDIHSVSSIDDIAPQAEGRRVDSPRRAASATSAPSVSLALPLTNLQKTVKKSAVDDDNDTSEESSSSDTSDAPAPFDVLTRSQVEIVHQVEATLHVEEKQYSPALAAYTAARALYDAKEYEKAYASFLEIHRNSPSKLYKACAAYYLGEMTLRNRANTLDLRASINYFVEAEEQTVDTDLLAKTFANLDELCGYSKAREFFDLALYEKAYERFLEVYEQSPSRLIKACAAHFLGQMNLGNHGDRRDTGLAISYLEEALKQTVDLELQAKTRLLIETLCGYVHARALYDAGNYAAAYESFLGVQKDAPSKSYRAVAAHFLGVMTLEGRGTDLNPPRAAKYFEEATTQTVYKDLQAESLARLGELYFYGYGVRQSQMKALYYLNQVIAYEQDPLIPSVNASANFRSKVTALYLLHQASSKSLGVPQEVEAVTRNYTGALRLCEETSNADGPDAGRAQLYKARLLLTQWKVSSDLSSKAWRCLVTASESKDQLVKAEALYRLGKLGLLNFKSTKQAKEFLEKALQVKVPSWIQPMVELYLGHVCVREEKTKKKPSYEQAIKHYEKALAQPYNSKAQYESATHLARLYELYPLSTLTEQQSWEKVLEYDMQAKAVGEVFGIPNVDPHFSLARHYYNGSPATPIDVQEAYTYFMAVTKDGQDFRQLEEAYFRLAEMSLKGGAIKKDRAFAHSCYEKIVAFREDARYTASPENKLFVTTALFEVAKQELNKGKDAFLDAQKHDSDEKDTKAAEQSFLRAGRLIKDLYKEIPSQDLLREAKLLRAELNAGLFELAKREFAKGKYAFLASQQPDSDEKDSKIAAESFSMARDLVKELYTQQPSQALLRDVVNFEEELTQESQRLEKRTETRN